MNLKDRIILQEKLEGLSKKSKKSKVILPTKIDFTNEFGEHLLTTENEIILPGAFFILEKLFNVNAPLTVPTINTDLLLNTDETPTGYTGPRRETAVCLFNIGIGGSDDVFGGVKAVQFKQKSINGMIPFRLVPNTADLTVSEREKYFMRRTEDSDLAYYLKKFELDPVIKCEYEDGTEVPANVWDSENNNLINVFIEMILKVDKKDVREYFLKNFDITQSKINTLGLCYGYPEMTAGGYTDYKGVKNLTTTTFNNRDLTDDLAELNISYKMYL